MSRLMSRRRFFQTSATATAAGAGAQWLSAGEENPVPKASPRAATFRFVHLTDIHVQPELRAGEGLTKCLAAAMRLEPRPDFILTGGDLVMDAFEQDAPRASRLFTLLGKVFADHACVPVRHCIGNHDVFAWGAKGVDKNHPQYGKRMAAEYLGLENRYYRFDHKGWRFFVLDDIQPAANNAYQAYLDEAQMAWLEAELRAKPREMPAAAVCHIPILTVTAFDDSQPEAYRVPTALMCRDAHRLVRLFAENNVRLALAGHLHQVDRVEFRGVTFLCDGAVCGAWWKGRHKGFGEGFGVVDLKSDGSIDHQYCGYGWNAVATPTN